MKGNKMRKTAISIALAAVATAASAQSVTIYGVMDTAVQSYDNGTSKYTRAADNLYGTSRLGFKATEHLGNGLYAGFNLEGQVNPSIGSMGSTTVASNEIFNREANVFLSGTFGEIRMGRTDVSRASEMDSLVNKSGNFGLSVTPGTAVEMGADQKNVIKYISPKFAGAWVELGQTTNSSGATTDAGTDQTGASISYSANGLALGLGYHKTDGAGVAKKDSTAAAIGYDFGVAAVGVNYVTADNSATADVTSKSTVARLTVPLSGGLTAHAIYAIGEDGSQTSGNKGTGYTMMLTKAMSKRTTLYAAYTSVDNEANSSMSMTGVTAPASAGLDTKAMTLGISHSF